MEKSWIYLGQTESGHHVNYIVRPALRKKKKRKRSAHCSAAPNSMWDIGDQRHLLLWQRNKIHSKQ